MQTYRLTAEEVVVINRLRLLPAIQQRAIHLAVAELAQHHPLAVVPANVIPLPVKISSGMLDKHI